MASGRKTKYFGMEPKYLLSLTIILVVASYFVLDLGGTTFIRTSFELNEDIGGFQLYEPFASDYGYRGAIYTTNDQALSGNYSLKFKTPTSWNHEVVDDVAVSTVGLVLFFDNPITHEGIVQSSYIIDGDMHTVNYPTLSSISRNELVVNPIFNCSFYASDDVRIRIDLTGWDFVGEPIGRGVAPWKVIDPFNNWVTIVENMVEALTDELSTDWFAIRSIEFRLYNEKAILSEIYSDLPCEVYIDDFSFYTGDPNAAVDYEDNSHPQSISFGASELIFLAVPVMILVKKMRKINVGNKTEDND